MEIDYNIRVRIIETKSIPNSINSYIYKIKRQILKPLIYPLEI